jgi:hypothetical protein
MFIKHLFLLSLLSFACTKGGKVLESKSQGCQNLSTQTVKAYDSIEAEGGSITSEQVSALVKEKALLVDLSNEKTKNFMVIWFNEDGSYELRKYSNTEYLADPKDKKLPILMVEENKGNYSINKGGVINFSYPTKSSCPFNKVLGQNTLKLHKTSALNYEVALIKHDNSLSVLMEEPLTVAKLVEKNKFSLEAFPSDFSLRKVATINEKESLLLYGCFYDHMRNFSESSK